MNNGEGQGIDIKRGFCPASERNAARRSFLFNLPYRFHIAGRVMSCTGHVSLVWFARSAGFRVDGSILIMVESADNYRHLRHTLRGRAYLGFLGEEA